MIEKDHILAEIRRTATENGGQALGKQRFANETGIGQSDWLGRYWTKWSDALAEVGLAPNEFRQPYDAEELLEKLASFVAELDRFPVAAEFRMKARSDKAFPSHTVWRRFGPKTMLVARLIQFCENRSELTNVLDVCREALPPQRSAHEVANAAEVLTTVGYVYLIKFRSEYKIGASSDPDRRFGEIATQMPEAMQKIHTIKTDDPFGVENYWHRRFEAKRLKGEWFKLSLADVRAFKRWRNIF